MLKIKVFDEEHEDDLSESVNAFLKKLEEKDIIDIKFATSHFLTAVSEQIFCYSCLVIYRDKIK